MKIIEILEDEASAANKPTLRTNAGGTYFWQTPSGQTFTVAGGFPDKQAAYDWAKQNWNKLSNSTAGPAAGTGIKSTLANVAGKAALPIQAGMAIWEGYSQIKQLPTDIDRQQYSSEVTKIVSKLVTDFGLFWVGGIIGGALAGAVSGPGALVGFIGGLAGGIALQYMAGDSVGEIVDAIVNAMYGTKNLRDKDGKTIPPKVKADATTMSQSIDKYEKPEEPVGPPPAKSNSAAKVASTGWRAIYDKNKDIIGSDPNRIYPKQKLQMPNGTTYTVKPGDTLSSIAART
jgi:LysM repeat protein